MDDTTKLLDQLRIERDPPPLENTSSSRRGLWIGLGSGLVIAAAVGGFSLFRSYDAQLVKTAAAETASSHAAATTTAPTASAAASNESAVLNASGYIVARRQATVSAKLTARVTQVLIDEGQEVKQDEIIAVLDDTNIKASYEYSRAQREQARASLRSAEQALANETPLFNRQQQQHERGISSAQDFDTAKAHYDAARASVDVATQSVGVAEASLAIASRNLEDTKVRAPFGGVVTVKAAQPGEMVSPNSAGGGFTRTGIGTIVDMNSLEVDVDVSESFINRISALQGVTVRLNAYPEWEIPGHVITVIPTADRAKATVKVRIGLDLKDTRILPDMGVRVSFLRTNAATLTTNSSTANR